METGDADFDVDPLAGTGTGSEGYTLLPDHHLLAVLHDQGPSIEKTDIKSCNRRFKTGHRLHKETARQKSCSVGILGHRQ